MRGLKKTAPDGANRQTNRQTDGHGDSMTNSAQRGRVGENFLTDLYIKQMVLLVFMKME